MAPKPNAKPKAKSPKKPATKRKYTRRTEDDKIAELHEKIRAVEERMKRKEVAESPLRKDFERFKKHAAKFTQACVDADRSDIANTVLGAVNVAESQVNDG